jgi:hypothetical protein
MLDFLAHPHPKTMTYKPGGAHPTGYLRALILAEMLDRMGFDADAGAVRRVWQSLYRTGRGHRMPGVLLQTARTTIPRVVDEIAFQTRRGLAQRALADVIPFSRADERAIRAAADALLRQRVPADLPPRFLVSASRYALAAGAPANALAERVIRHLSDPANAPREAAHVPLAIAA